jgi:anti-sigma B factor antagonist
MSMDPGAFSVSTAEDDGRAVVVPRGELDIATAPELETVVRERLDAGQDVVVDLRELSFMDSTGLRVLVSAHARAGAPRFALVRPAAGSAVAKLLAIAGVEDQLELLDEL